MSTEAGAGNPTANATARERGRPSRFPRTGDGAGGVWQRWSKARDGVRG